MILEMISLKLSIMEKLNFELKKSLKNQGFNLVGLTPSKLEKGYHFF